jgi:hypothetical protein
MYEKPSANNEVHLMNEFNTIINQLSSVEMIDFDDEIRALIVLASLPNS